MDSKKNVTAENCTVALNAVLSWHLSRYKVLLYAVILCICGAPVHLGQIKVNCAYSTFRDSFQKKFQC